MLKWLKDTRDHAAILHLATGRPYLDCLREAVRVAITGGR